MHRSARQRLVRIVAMLAAATLASGCQYWQMAAQSAGGNGPAPWFCDPTAPNSVTGPGMGTVDWYASVTRAPLNDQDCATFAGQLDMAKGVAEYYPTLGVAEARGFDKAFAFIPGMGTHHAFEGITPELLHSPSFDRFDPIVPNTPMDEEFDPTRPEFLQFNGNTPDSVLIGMSWYVRTEDGLPPEGFAGDNDWWHHHPTLCLSNVNAEVVGVNTTDATCAPRNGVNVHMDKYFMLHTWQVDDLEYHADVFAPMHPCILSTGAIFDMDDPCHDSAGGGGFQARAAEGAAGAEGVGAAAIQGFCQLNQIEEQWLAGA